MRLPGRLVLLLMAFRCEARECNREDVMSNGRYELAGCTTLYIVSKQSDSIDDSIGDDGAKVLAEALKRNGALTRLYVSSNSIGDKGAMALAEALKSNIVLTRLSLSSNSIGDKGASALADALKNNNALTALDLEGNSIGNEGARALAEALKSNSALTTLDLESNSIGDEGARALAGALKSNGALAVLDMEGNSYGHESARALDDARAAVEKAAAVAHATSLGIYAIFQEYGVSDDALIRAVQWCRDMGADAADDLAYLRPEEIVELVSTLDLPKLKQRKLADALSVPLGKDEI